MVVVGRILAAGADRRVSRRTVAAAAAGPERHKHIVGGIAGMG